MMPKPTTKPPRYRLTLTVEAGGAFIRGVRGGPLPRPYLREDGLYDMGISYALLDQLQTAALPKENLSDTLLRLYPPAAPAA